MTNDAFIDVFVMGLDSAAIAIVELQLRSIGDMGDQLAIRLRSMRPSSDLFVLWTDCHRSPPSGMGVLSVNIHPMLLKGQQTDTSIHIMRAILSCFSVSGISTNWKTF